MIFLLFFTLFWIFEILLIHSEYIEIWTGWILFNRVNTWPRVSKASKAYDRRLFSQDLFPSGSVRAICTNHLIISLITLQNEGIIPIWQILKIKVKEIGWLGYGHRANKRRAHMIWSCKATFITTLVFQKKWDMQPSNSC